MKKYIFLVPMILAALAFFSSCQKETLDPNSVIVVSSTQKTPLDQWLEANYRTPYNSDFKYRFEMNESDVNYYTIPADYDCANMMAHLVKYLCVDTYDEVAGAAFTRQTFPKMFFLMGEWEYRNNGTFILGTAEGGRKILLSGVNYLPQYVGSAESLNYYYIKTIHHEFTHILNQTKDYPTDSREVSFPPTPSILTGKTSLKWSPCMSPMMPPGGTNRSPLPELRALTPCPPNWTSSPCT